VPLMTLPSAPCSPICCSVWPGAAAGAPARLLLMFDTGQSGCQGAAARRWPPGSQRDREGLGWRPSLRKITAHGRDSLPAGHRVSVGLTPPRAQAAEKLLLAEGSKLGAA